MTRSLAINSNRDIYMDSNKNIAVVTGKEACAQNSVTAMSAQLSEMVYATSSGMPMQATAFDRYDTVGFEMAARAILLQVRDVLDVTAFAVSQQGAILVYSATLSTIYGEVVING